MKIKEGFALRQVAGTWVVLPLTDATVDFNGMLTLNDSGLILFKMLENDTTKEEMAASLTSEYDVDYNDALADVDAFVEKLKKAGCIDE